MDRLPDLSRPLTTAQQAQQDRDHEAREIIKASVGLLTRIHLHIERSKGNRWPAGGRSMFADGDELDNAIEALNALVIKYEKEE